MRYTLIICMIVALLIACSTPAGPEGGTPTPEHCVDASTDYQVNVNTLNIRIAPGTQHEVLAQLRRGDRFTSTLCSTEGDHYLWVEIAGATHPYRGGWVARYALPYVEGEEFLLFVP